METNSASAPAFCSECGRPTSPDELARFGDHMVCPYCKESYVQKLREGVAPVSREFHFGGFWIRFVAHLLDQVILGIVGGVLWLLATSLFMPGLMQPKPVMTGDEALAQFGPFMIVMVVAGLLSTAMSCAYSTFFVCRIGATPGKMALSLKVVRPDGGPISAGRAAGRYFAEMISGLILGIGYIMAAFDSEKRALHDMICDTRVIRVRN